MTVTVRFAPSPTGYIHIGNTRTALSNWLYAKKNGGAFILRYDDTDVERSKQEYADAIAVDLDWLGVKPDRIEYQSKRFDVYAKAVEKLKQAGLLYACYETADELERRRGLRLARRLPPVYGREALKLTDEEKAALKRRDASLTGVFFYLILKAILCNDAYGSSLGRSGSRSTDGRSRVNVRPCSCS